jgi:hypothetical protein
MTTYYVATRARYVLVGAADEDAARERGRIELRKKYVDARQCHDRDVWIEIHTVRPATADEIELGRWHAEMVEREAAR